METKKNIRPLVVSQDRDEIFLTFASFHADYLRYLTDRDGPTTDNSFLVMQSYGPFKTYNAGNMRLFAQIIVAITLCSKNVS
jgi:hypothetical protein